ncbi:MAG: hypothetical protein WBN07_02355, partial [Woeseiaceae bacterium]
MMSTKKIVEQNINVEHLFDDILLLTEVPVLVDIEPKKPEAWQPIETAPKGIDWILLGYHPDYLDRKPQGQHPTIAYWDGDTWVDCCGRKLKKTGAFSQTHWMQLPDSPS